MSGKLNVCVNVSVKVVSEFEDLKINFPSIDAFNSKLSPVIVKLIGN